MLSQEDYFKNIFNTVREAILILDENLRVVSANRSFFETFKVNSADTIGTLLYDLGNRQWNIPYLRVLLEDVLPKNDTVDDYEIEHNFESIGHKTMLINACKIREKNNDQPIILLAIEDITERKRLEDLLAESEMQYRRLFETASDGIVLLEKEEGHIVHANPAAEKMLGYSKEEYVGKKLQDIGVSIDMTDFSAVMQDLNKRGILNYEDVSVKTRSGLYIEADIYMVDRAKLAQFNIRDVSERRRAVDALQKSEERFRQIADNTNEWIWEVNGDGLYTYSSPVIEHILGYKPEEVVGKKHFYDFLPSDKREQIKKEALELLSSKGKIEKYVNPNVHKNGSIVLLETTGIPIFDSRGDLQGYRGVDIDITEQKKLEAQLLHAQKMEAVGTLAGGIAHDFNNILNVIMGYGSMVMDKLEAGSIPKEQMNEVLMAAEKAAVLTKRLLFFSRKQLAELKPVNINEIIIGLQKMLERVIGEDIEFKLDLSDRSLTVMADPGQIEQVLMNLVTNAKDALPEGGHFSISTELKEMDDEYVEAYGYGEPGKYALITVADTGQGMDEETKQKLFDPFFTTKEVGKGTGLGLSITYGIIKKHNGYIKVYSEPGKGTTFKIYLPLIEEAAVLDQKIETFAAVKGGTETILVAEDDASLRKLSRTVLEAFGYIVITAEDGEDAITKFIENRDKINLVILDMIMPKKSGKEACNEIKTMSPDIKTLFVSGYTMDAMRVQGIIEEGFDFVLKPVSPKDLVRKVREILDR